MDLHKGHTIIWPAQDCPGNQDTPRKISCLGFWAEEKEPSPAPWNFQDKKEKEFKIDVAGYFPFSFAFLQMSYGY